MRPVYSPIPTFLCLLYSQKCVFLSNSIALWAHLNPPMLPYNLPLLLQQAAQLPALPSFCADSQRSHLSSFTMKLMDKFHSPKIKRTPSKKGKQLQPEPAVKSTEKPANKVCVRACLEVRSVGNPPLSQPLFPTVFV